MSTPNRTQIENALKLLLEKIRVTSGYYTDLGLNVEISANRANPDEAERIQIVPGRESAERLHGQVDVFFDMEISATLECDQSEQRIVINQLHADIVKAVETYDSNFYGVVSGVDYQGMDPVFNDQAGKLVGCRVQYRFAYSRERGEPNTIT